MSEDIFILFALICVVGALKEEAAQGHFTTPIRIIGPLALLAVWIVVWYFRGSQAGSNSSDVTAKTPYPVRLMPRPNGRIRILFWIVGIGIVVILSLIRFDRAENQTLLGVFAAASLFMLFFYREKCPQCKTRLNGYRLKEDHGRTRLYHDCPTCQTTWKSPTTSMVSID